MDYPILSIEARRKAIRVSGMHYNRDGVFVRKVDTDELKQAILADLDREEVRANSVTALATWDWLPGARDVLGARVIREPENGWVTVIQHVPDVASYEVATIPVSSLTDPDLTDRQTVDCLEECMRRAWGKEAHVRPLQLHVNAFSEETRMVWRAILGNLVLGEHETRAGAMVEALKHHAYQESRRGTPQ